MNHEQALSMIQICLQIINDDMTLKLVQDAIIEKRIDLAKPKTRSYNRKTIERVDC